MVHRRVKPSAESYGNLHPLQKSTFTSPTASFFSVEIRRQQAHVSLVLLHKTFDICKVFNLILGETLGQKGENDQRKTTKLERKPTCQNDFLEQNPFSNQIQHIFLDLQHIDSCIVLLSIYRSNPIPRIQIRLAMGLRFAISTSRDGPSGTTQPIQRLPTHNLQLQINAPPHRRPLLDA
jgi:hypothetical protein